MLRSTVVSKYLDSDHTSKIYSTLPHDAPVRCVLHISSMGEDPSQGELGHRLPKVRHCDRKSLFVAAKIMIHIDTLSRSCLSLLMLSRTSALVSLSIPLHSFFGGLVDKAVETMIGVPHET